jgi:MFS-type transporter involved in bile tolerance (Atg22 family)
MVHTGFVYSQGVNESFIGILTAVGAVFGILGSVSFPLLRRKLGKNKTGILGFFLESLCLLLCVGSIFASGSPFKPAAIWDRFDNVSGSHPSGTSHQNLSLRDILEKETNVILLLVGIVLARYGNNINSEGNFRCSQGLSYFSRPTKLGNWQ